MGISQVGAVTAGAGYRWTGDEVRRLCAPFGEVHSVAMINERGSGRFRGFCFVEMKEAAAKKAIKALEGKEVGGREIRASEAMPRKDKGQGRRQGNERSDDRPLHERTDRGNYVGRGSFPHSGGGWGPQREPAGGSSEFPHSGGADAAVVVELSQPRFAPDCPA